MDSKELIKKNKKDIEKLEKNKILVENRIIDEIKRIIEKEKVNDK